MFAKFTAGSSLAVQVVRTPSFHCWRAWVPSAVRELRSLKLRGAAKSNNNNNNTEHCAFCVAALDPSSMMMLMTPVSKALSGHRKCRAPLDTGHALTPGLDHAGK